jgi:hypothetical protein
MIRFTCPSRKKVSKAPDGYAGRKTACEGCGAVLAIPGQVGHPPGPPRSRAPASTGGRSPTGHTDPTSPRDRPAARASGSRPLPGRV